MAFKIGITGGIGCGKSVVSQLLEVMGIPIYISDKETRRVIQTDSSIRWQLSQLVGEDVFRGGTLNRSLLANYMFGYPDRINKVNEIIHPKVKMDFRHWAESFGSGGIVGIESAILLEAGFRTEVDYLVMVYAPLDIRVDRVVKRDRFSREEVMRRVNSQSDDGFKREQSDFIILNDGKEALIPQVLRLLSILYRNNCYLCHANNFNK